ncbi:MAG: YCF48-related protein [Flavisolibacter sp.]
MKKLGPFFFSLILSFCGKAQKIPPTVSLLTQGTPTALRGLCVVNNNVVWVSGSNGTVARSSNGGKDWKWFKVKGFEKTDFRDIEAFDGSTAVIMGVGQPAFILRTTDGGDTWKVVYENQSRGMFLDAMEFWNMDAGIVIGDPVNGKFFIARTFDGGASWKEIPDQYKPVADSGEACFAASGTNIRALDNDEAVFVTGGTTSHLFVRDTKIPLPIIQGTETTGANSISVWNRYKKNGGDKLVVVGGDFMKDSSSFQNCIYSTNRGKSWKSSRIPPHGYRSCVEYLAKNQLVTCGLTGVDYSFDGAETWQAISKESFHVVRIAKNGTSVFLAGPNGKIARLVFSDRKKGIK